jgi:hypothetical protein
VILVEAKNAAAATAVPAARIIQSGRRLFNITSPQLITISPQRSDLHAKPRCDRKPIRRLFTAPALRPPRYPMP